MGKLGDMGSIVTFRAFRQEITIRLVGIAVTPNWDLCFVQSGELTRSRGGRIGERGLLFVSARTCPLTWSYAGPPRAGQTTAIRGGGRGDQTAIDRAQSRHFARLLADCREIRVTAKLP